MSPETKGTSAHLLHWYKSWCSSELTAGSHRLSLPAPGWKERGHGQSPVHHQEPRRADTARPTKDAPAQFKGKVRSSCGTRPLPTAQPSRPGTRKPSRLHSASGCRAGKMICSDGS